MATWTSPATAVTGDILQASWGNTYIRDNTQYLYDNKIAIPASSAQGDLAYRDASGWTRLPAGTSGQFLQTQGAAADPQWANGVKAEFHVMMSMGGYTTTSTSTTNPINGSRITFTPGNWPSSGISWYFEVVMYINNALGTASAALYNVSDSSVIDTLTTTSITETIVRSSSALTMPGTEKILRVNFYSDNASYTTTVYSARLIGIFA